jgi:hypothetical protein
MFTFSRLRSAVIAGGVFFAALWIVEDLRTDRLIRTAVMAIGFGILDITFGHWFRKKWMAMFHRSIRKKIAERNES